MNTGALPRLRSRRFPHPLIPFPVNCYGRYVISHHGFGFPYAEANKPLDPPSPSPKRCFDLGRAAAP